MSIDEGTLRKLGNEIGVVLLQGVNARIDKLETDLLDTVKRSVDSRFMDIGVDVRDEFRRREEFKFLRDMKEEWDELKTPLKTMVKEWQEKKESDKAARQAVKNRLYVGAAVIAIIAVLAYLLGVDVTKIIGAK